MIEPTLETQTPTLNLLTTFCRDSNGLLGGVSYKFKPDGSIDWRAMVKPEYLAVQKEKREQVEKQYGKKIEELDISTIEDKYILLLLQGIKELLRMRGFKYVQQKVDYVSDHKAVVTCTIQFSGNFETDNKDVFFSDVASASMNNTSGFGQNFLESIAANRAFVRTVRNFLGINIVGQDEISPKGANDEQDTQTSTDYSPAGILLKKMEEKNITFEQLKSGCLTKYKAEVTDPDSWKSVADISKLDCFTLLGKLEKTK